MAMGSGLRCVGFGCIHAPVPGSIYCSNRCILKHAAYAIQRLEKSREMHANGGKPTTVVSVKQEIISFVVANDKVKKRSSVVPDDVEREKGESIIPLEPRRAALNIETDEGSTRDRKAQPTHEGGVIPSGVFYKPEANDNKEARLRDTLHILREERADKRQSLASGKKRRLAPREARDKREMKNQNSNEIAGEAQQHCNPAKVAKVAAVDWQIRQTVRKAFRDTLLKRFKEMGGQKVNMKDVARLALQIEKELYAFLGHAESKYKTKYRTLSFNLKDQKNKGLCGQVLAGEVSPHTVVRMSPQQMASQELAEWRARENKHTIELIEREQQQMEKRPITKTTHKGLVEIGDATSLVDMQNSTMEREVDKRSGRKAFLQRRPALLDAAKQGASQLSDHNWKFCKVKDTDEPSSKKAQPAASPQQAELGERASQHPPASADMTHSSTPDAGPPLNGEAGDTHGGEAAESAAAHSNESPRVSGASPHTLSSPAPTEVLHNDDINDSLEVIVNDDGDDDDDDNGVNRDGDETTCAHGSGGSAPGFQQDTTGGQPTRRPMEESCGLIQKIRGSQSLCDAMPEIVQGPLVDVHVSELPCKPLNESDCEEKWISSPVTDTQQLAHIRSPEKGKDAKAASLLAEIWKGFIGLPNVAKVVMKAYPVSGPTDNLTEDLPDSIQIGGRIHPQVVWDYLYKLKATPSKEACIIRFVPASVEERDGYQSVFSYLSGRKRYGVISNNSHSVKDLYIIPTGAGQKFPSSLLSLLGPGLNNTETGAIVGVLVRQKVKRQQAEEQIREGPADCRAEQRATKTCDAQRRAHPPNACLKCTGASHSADARNPKAEKNGPESQCDQGGAARKNSDNNSKAECASTGKISPIAEPTHHGGGREPADLQKVARGHCQLSQQQPLTGTAAASDRPQNSSILGSEEHAQRGHSVKTSTRGSNPVRREQTGKFNNETPILNFKLNQKNGLAGKNVDAKSNGVPGEVFPHSAVIQHNQDASQIINKQPLKGNKRAEVRREPVPMANNPGGQVYRRLLFSTAALSEKGHGLASTEINPTRSQTDVSTPNAATARAPRDPRTRRPGAFPNVPVTDARHAAAVRGAVKEDGQGDTVPRNVTEGLSVRGCADVQSCRANNDSNPLITTPPNVPHLSNAIQKRVSAPRLPSAQEPTEAGRVFECEPMEKICAVATTRGGVSPPVNARVPPPSEEALGQTKALLPTPPPHSHVPPDVLESPPSFGFPPPRCPPGPPPFPIGLFPPLEPPPFEQPFFEYYDPRPRFPARMPFHHLAQEFHPRWFHPFHQPRWPAVGPLFRPYSVRPPRRRFPRAIDDV
ncbi:PHD finger protein 3-like [Lethenteron reissneri]|uniref:PHD finger protein 3-like n=1 Tax=Lethenteron reissneri TaxID=7753 RepID=UPI002AB6F885|nr:PHD finger protein 3-like [Lethenteron reissneri]